MTWPDRFILTCVIFSIVAFIAAYINNGSMWTYVPSFVALIAATIAELLMERKP